MVVQLNTEGYRVEILDPEKTKTDYWKTRWGKLDQVLQNSRTIPMSDRRASAQVQTSLNNLEKRQSKWI